MDIQEIKKRNAYNRAFYTRHGESFAQTRTYFWPSWFHFVQASEIVQTENTLQVLDIGCGSGRLATFLDEQLGDVECTYQGIDISPTLLTVAEKETADLDIPVSFIERDVVEEMVADALTFPENVSLITLFGVLHHIPSFELRKELLQRCVDAVAVGGEVWFTIWNPERVGKKTPQEIEALSEDTDAVIGWKNIPEAERYVHWMSQEEEMKLLHSLTGCRVVESWVEDTQGERGNMCYILQKV